MNKVLAALAVCLAIFTSVEANAQAVTWQETTVVGTNPDNSKAPIGYFVNSYTVTGPAANVWTDIDVTQFGVPATAKEVLLSGVLIISGGSTFQTCDLLISARAPGSTWNPANYIDQVINVGSGNGQRAPMSTMAPVVNGKIELWWNRIDTDATQWPEGCAYGVNLSIQAYLR